MPFLFIDIATATKENIVTALTTEADKPAIKAKAQSNNKITKVFISSPFLRVSKGLKIKFKINKIIPTCNPETAKI